MLNDKKKSNVSKAKNQWKHGLRASSAISLFDIGVPKKIIGAQIS